MSRGCILVTGGCGCLGSHVIEQLLNDALFTSVHALDVNIHHEGHWSRKAKVVYHEGDVLFHQTVAALLSELKPVAIIHTASPPSVGTKGVERRMFDTNVIGTKFLLDHAEVNECRAFVYTSSVGVLEGTSFDAVDESHPILTGESRGSLYGRSKAIADQMVRDYDDPKEGFRTAVLRMCQFYGVGATNLKKHTIDQVNTAKSKFQIGDNTSLNDFISAPNAARAHLLAMYALLDRRRTRVGGEAFFITDGHPVPFWDFRRTVLAAAGDRTSPEEIWVIPAWFALALASIIEWLFWILTLGSREPQVWRRWLLSYVCLSSTYSIQKARNRLGYEPRDDRLEVIHDAIRWARKRI